MTVQELAVDLQQVPTDYVVEFGVFINSYAWNERPDLLTDAQDWSPINELELSARNFKRHPTNNYGDTVKRVGWLVNALQATNPEHVVTVAVNDYSPSMLDGMAIDDDRQTVLLEIGEPTNLD